MESVCHYCNITDKQRCRNVDQAFKCLNKKLDKEKDAVTREGIFHLIKDCIREKNGNKIRHEILKGSSNDFGLKQKINYLFQHHETYNKSLEEDLLSMFLAYEKFSEKNS